MSDPIETLRAMVDALPGKRWTVDATCAYDPESAAWVPEAMTVPDGSGDMSAATAETIAALRNLAPRLLAVVEAAVAVTAARDLGNGMLARERRRADAAEVLLR